MVDVSANRHGRQQFLATMQGGAVFCSARTRVVLLEMSRGRCERLLRGGSQLAIKFLETLNGTDFGIAGRRLAALAIGRTDFRCRAASNRLAF
jgi:hypothetical protein